MHNYINRRIEQVIKNDFKHFPVTAIIGPRQSGKSTTAKKVIDNIKDSVYLDLELHGDLSQLNEPELFFHDFRDKLICLNEIQRKPELFSVLRGIVDKTGKPGQILILGSASPELLKQSSESLSGRIVYEYITPFTQD